MATIGSYSTRNFDETQKFVVYDPDTSTTSLVLGSDLVSYVTGDEDYVINVSTLDVLKTESYEVGRLIQTTGGSLPGDGSNALYLIVGPGEGDEPIFNGNEALQLPRGSLAGSDATNANVTYDGVTETVGEAFSKRTSYISDVSEIQNIDLSVTADGAVINVVGYHPNSDKGGGPFYWNASLARSSHNGGTIISPTCTWDGTAADLPAFIDGTNETSGGSNGCWVRIYSGRLNPQMFGAYINGSDDAAPSYQALLNEIPVNETRHFDIFSGDYALNSTPTLPSGADVVWQIESDVTFTGAGDLPREFNSIRNGRTGLSIGGDIYLGKNSGSPSNPDANGGVTLGGYTDRVTDQDQDGMRVEGEGSNAHNAVTYCTRKGGQSQWNHQVIPVFGTCDTSGTTVTRVSGTDFSSIEAAAKITINRIEYDVASIDSADQITLTTSAGTQTGVKYRIATVYHKALCDISGTTVTRTAGETFASPVSVAFINGVRYSATFVDQDTLTLGSAPGDTTDQIVFGCQEDTGVVAQRIQVQPGADEQSMVWGFREDVGYFLTSVITGSGEHRNFEIGAGNDGDNLILYADGAVDSPHSHRFFGTPIIAGSSLNIGRYSSGHPSRAENNISAISHDRPSAGNGGIAIDFYVDTVYDKTPVYYDQDGHWLPGADNAYDVGSGSLRMRTIYAGTGTINTSDARDKTDVRDLSEAEKAVALKIKQSIKLFRFKDAVKEKGDGARVHCGVIAQEVAEIFKSEGLDPDNYALFCYDEWEEEVTEWDDQYVFDDKAQKYTLAKAAGRRVRPAGSRYGIRYEELLAFVVSAM